MDDNLLPPGDNGGQGGSGGQPHGDYQTIAGFISASITMLTNAQGPDILPKLEGRGYPQDDMKTKIAELEALATLNEAQAREYGEQYTATEAYQTAFSALNEDYIDHIRLARIAFKKNVGAFTALGLRGRRAKSQSGYAAQGLLFYNNAIGNADYVKALKSKGIDMEDLTAGRDAFKNLQNLSSAQQKETGEAQEATKARDAAYDALHDWMGDFRETAKVALRKYPQLSEQLGIKDPS